MVKNTAEQLLLTGKEVELLREALMEWSGPARCTDEFAVAMGFSGAVDLPGDCRRIRSALLAGDALESIDWAKALLATEIAFVSDVIGSGYEWSTTTGWSDELTIKVLRAVQRKLVRIVAPLVGDGLGTRPSEF